MQRRQLLHALAASAVIGPRAGWAQDKYPSKPISFICPYAAGGNADQRSRQIGRYLSTAFGQPVLVENKPGAGGNIGTEAVARARPDGYTIGMGNFAPLAVNPTMFQKINFDPAKDLIPVCLIEKGPLVCIQLYFDGARTGETCDRKHRAPDERWQVGAVDMASGKLLEPASGDAGPAGADAGAADAAAPKKAPPKPAPKK